MTRPRLWRILEPLLAVVLLTLAVLALRHLLRQYSIGQIVGSVRRLKRGQIALAGMLTCFGYLTLTFYDVLGLRHLGKPVGYPRVFLAALCAFTAGHNLGFTPLTSLPIRFKFYEPVGLNAVDVGELFLFTSLTFAIGFTVVGGLTLSFLSLPAPEVLHLPLKTLHPVGWIMLALLAAYVLACARLRKPIHIRGRRFRLPNFRMALAQIVLSSIDWSIAGAVLFVLLPDEARLSYVRFMGVYSLATIRGSSSHVPGGLGIFETLILGLMSGTASGVAIAGSLLAYRVIFSLAPFAVAIMAVGIALLARRLRGTARMRDSPATIRR